MRDRIPTELIDTPHGKALRYAVYNADGTLNRYEYIVAADEPTDEGSPLNKATLLSDAAAGILALAGDPTVSDAFLAVAGIIGGGYPLGVTVLTHTNDPVPGVVVSGILDIHGNAAVTDANGFVLGFAATSTIVISVTSTFIDLSDGSKEVTGLGSTPTYTTLTLPAVSPQYVAFNSATSVKFSPAVQDVDVCCVGGGGGGGAGYYYAGDEAYSGGGGGGGGHVTNGASIVPVPGTSYPVVVGAAGNGGTAPNTQNTLGTNGSGGGASSAFGVSASGGGGGKRSSGDGGSGGAGNGAGGRGELNYTGSAGGAGTVREFGDAGRTLYSGGGGGAGGGNTGGAGGSSYGGTGGGGTNPGTAAQNGMGPGGGGGGGTAYRNGGNGSAGRVAIRWRNKA